jgi:hypothetical protein
MRGLGTFVKCFFPHLTNYGTPKQPDFELAPKVRTG